MSRLPDENISLYLDTTTLFSESTYMYISQLIRTDIIKLNALPSYVVNAKDLNDFKSKLDVHWNHERTYQ